MARWPRRIVSSTAAMTPAAAQEPLAEQRQAGSGRTNGSADRAAWPVGRGDGGACGRHRGRRQQITAGRLRVNRDASLSFAAPASGSSGRHARRRPRWLA